MLIFDECMVEIYTEGVHPGKIHRVGTTGSREK